MEEERRRGGGGGEATRSLGYYRALSRARARSCVDPHFSSNQDKESSGQIRRLLYFWEEEEEVQEPVLHILDLVEELLFLVELIWDLVMDKVVMLLAEMDLAAVVLMENIKLVLPLLLGV